MTLGDIIKEYLETHTVSEFVEDSGISKAYTYNLINNRGTNGAAPTPTLETISKVAKGIHSDFDTVFAKLDQNTILSAGYRRAPERIFHDLVYFKITESSLGSFTVQIKEPYKNYIPFLGNKTIRKLLDATVGCSDEQIDVAINMLNAFKK